MTWSDTWIRLSPLECEVLGKMRRKQSIKWIAYEMGITENHAYQTAHRAYRKLGVNNRTDATLAHPRHTRSPNLPCFIRKARVRKAAVA